jgi:UDP-hydrolysing UDP-N-acetyl-D-glucosamine 2-epimerase
LWDIDTLNHKFDLDLTENFLLVTYHPVTTDYENTEWQIDQLLQALEDMNMQVLFTMPNADPGGMIIRNKVAEFTDNTSNASVIENLGTQGYFSAMSTAKAMIGNSSSGIVEASLFKLPVVNIGTRQQGRIRSSNILDVGYQKEEICAGIKKAVSADFQEAQKDVANPFGDGRAAQRIIEKLKNVPFDKKLLNKYFIDYDVNTNTHGGIP